MSCSTAGRRPSSRDSGRSPTSKRIRKSHDEDIGKPIEDDATAKRKLREAGFDPDRVSDELRRDFPIPGYVYYTPMIYFCYKGDMPMCRYLLVHGTRADVTRSCSNDFWFPMYAAVQKGHVDVCQWLFDRGAAGDVSRRVGKSSWSPLKSSLQDRREKVYKWLILNGALHDRPDGAFNTKSTDEVISFVDTRKSMEKPLSSLKSWVLDTTASHESFHVFLVGTLPLRANDSSAALQSILSRNLRSEKAAMRIMEKTPPEDHTFLLYEVSSPLHVLGGFPGILEVIADFVGIMKQRCGRDRLRDLAQFLAKWQPGESGEDESEGDESHYFLSEEVYYHEDYSITYEEDSNAHHLL